MKKIIITATILIFGCCAFAQSEPKPYKPLKEFNYKPKEYLKYNFQERKELYVGKPLSELLKDCELPVMSLLDSPGGFRMEYVDTDFFFEDKKTTDYRMQQKHIPVRIIVEWQTPLNMDVVDKRLRTYGNNWNMINQAFYETQTVGDVVVVGKNFSDMPAVPDLKDDSGVTPCCAPIIIPPSNSADATSRQAIKTEVAQDFEVLNNAKFAMYKSNTTPYSWDNIKTNTLMDMAKDYPQPVSIIAVDVSKNFSSNLSIFNLLWKDSLQTGSIGKYHNKYSLNSHYINTFGKYIYSTIPSSAFGYKFNALTGYDLYNYLNISPTFYYLGVNAKDEKNMVYNRFYTIAYDGTVYALRIKKEERYSSSFNGILLRATKLYEHQIEMLVPNAEKYLKWGFIAGGRMQEEFLDCFRRLYKEGEGFSKEDAYNAAFAYILEGWGVELHRRAPGSVEFKRYNTTSVKDAGGKITGFYSTIWQ